MVRQSTDNDCETIVIGAGPYGLAIAAHLDGTRRRYPHIR